MREPFHVRLIRGDLSGPGPALLRLLLAPPSWLFAAAAETRAALYRAGVFTCHCVPRPVVSVGNLTVGGTGKTPLVEWVVREARLLGLHAVVLTRGYGAAGAEVPDEVAVLAENLPDVRVVRDPDRVRGALTAIERHGAEALVLDDGFQHHRIRRQLDLVTVDALLPFGSGHCLPRGMLREPVRALRRAQAVVVTRSDQVPPAALERIQRRIRRVAPRAVLARAEHAPVAVRPLGGGPDRPPIFLAGRSVLAVSGIGNPAAFEATLAGIGAKVAGRLRFPDHHRYCPDDLARVAREAEAAGAEAIVTTQKDAVKWSGKSGGRPAYSLVVSLRLTHGEEAIKGLLRDALRGASPCG